MQHEEYDRMHELEDEYWWFVARRKLICSFLDKLPSDKSKLILDIGCGTGAMLDELRRYGEVVGADFAPEALKYCMERGKSNGHVYRLTRADARALPMKTNSVDIVTAMDVIEHLDNDKAALNEISRVLRPGGYLLATVPANQALWSEHDVALHHYRRYTLQGFTDVIQRAGLSIVKGSYTITALFPAVWVYRMVNRTLSRRKANQAPKADLVKVSKWVNNALIKLCAIETKIVNALNLPFGLTVVVVAQKQKDGSLRPATAVQEASLVGCGNER